MLTEIKKLESMDLDISIKKDYIDMAVDQINLLHHEDDGFITIAVKKDSTFIQHHYKVNTLKMNIGKALAIKDTNIYITPNSFYKPFRKIENIRKLNALYIDIDYYKIENLKFLSFEEVTEVLYKSYFKDKLPEPNFIVDTGRGMAVYWLIEPVPYKALPLWNVLEKDFLNKLIDIGADNKSIDSARIMRLSGSINQKSGNLATIHIVNGDSIYRLRDLQEKYLPVLNKCKSKISRAIGKNRIVNFYNLYSLHYARFMDLIKLQEIRKGYCRNKKGELVESSQREFMCFLYRYWSCCYLKDSVKALEDTLDFNRDFISPLGEKEVQKASKSAEKAYSEWLKDSPNGIYNRGGYNYKNETLIDKLCITQEEMKSLSTIIDKGEVKRRNNERTKEAQKIKWRNEEGLTKRQLEKERKLKRIVELREKGCTQKDIAFKLKITQQAVSKMIREIAKFTRGMSVCHIYFICFVYTMFSQLDLEILL